MAAIALVAVPAARFLARCLLEAQPPAVAAVTYGPAGGMSSRERRRRQLLRAARRATEDAAAAGSVSATEQQLLELVTQPSMSRPERVRTIARVLEWLQQLEADTAPRSEWCACPATSPSSLSSAGWMPAVRFPCTPPSGLLHGSHLGSPQNKLLLPAPFSVTSPLTH
jgi:hypothetical protein